MSPIFRSVMPALLLAFFTTLVQPVQAQRAELLTHVHGLAYSADGRQLMIPSHHGLAVFEDGRWSKAAGPAHDYMGFSATRSALYSSGHPAPGSGLTNPFGVIRSADGGKSWKKLGLEGESDFHLLATGYDSNAIYVVNQAPNSRMKMPGLYHSSDDGRLWQRATANGLADEIKSIAVHPTDAAIVAVGTRRGLYLSRDAGARFEPLVTGGQVLGISFAVDGRQLWYGSHDGQASLARIGLAGGAQPQRLPAPPLSDDAVAYIAQNPARPAEWAIATFKRNVYVSADDGQTWKQIASQGTAT